MPPRPPHLPTVWERMGLEALRGGHPVPDGVGPRTMATLVRKGWIEEGPPGVRAYSITEAGIEAIKRKLS